MSAQPEHWGTIKVTNEEVKFIRDFSPGAVNTLAGGLWQAYHLEEDLGLMNLTCVNQQLVGEGII